MSSSRRIPVDVCNALLMLGVPSDGVTEHLVINAWKRQIVEAELPSLQPVANSAKGKH